MSNGSVVRTMTYTMKPFLEKCVESYIALSGRPLSSLQRVSTPYLPEEPGSGPARAPCPDAVCSCCGRALPNASHCDQSLHVNGELIASACAGVASSVDDCVDSL